jgi:hypothetical protein
MSRAAACDALVRFCIRHGAIHFRTAERLLARNNPPPWHRAREREPNCGWSFEASSGRQKWNLKECDYVHYLLTKMRNEHQIGLC